MLLSNTQNVGGEPLEHARAVLARALSGVDEIVFVPYALHDRDAYTARIARAYEPLGVRVRALHREPDPAAALRVARAIHVGGGNTFRLLRALQEVGGLEAIRRAVRDGAVYLSASAGTNIAAPTIATTNDMPIVEPRDFGALGLVPFQINCHYLDAPATPASAEETRALRLAQYLEENPGPVLALREGTWIDVDGGRTCIGGRATGPDRRGPAVLFERGREPREIDGDITPMLAG